MSITIFPPKVLNFSSHMFGANPGYDPSQGGGWSLQQAPPQQAASQPPLEAEESDASHRPPNAFILYSQAMRSAVRQDNPSLSNTEVSSLLGKMWKEVPNEAKLSYKQKAAQMQEEFKRQHPDYTYRKARRKRALNELLTKSGQGAPGLYTGDPMAMYQQMMQNPGMYTGMAQGFPGQNPTGMYPGMGQMGIPQGMNPMQGMNQMQGMQQGPGMFYPSQFPKQN
jgi:transcription factor SOX7/8/10/18 (SOX group E/F)